MAMTWLWTGMVALSLAFGAATGNLGALGGAALEGARSAVELCVTMAGVLCLWTGVMEVMAQSGLSARLARLFSPLLRRLFPRAYMIRHIVSRPSRNAVSVCPNISAR